MPQLLAFVPCEKVIVSNEQSVSMISVLDTLTMALPAGVSALEPNSMTHIRWTAVTMYRRLPEDGDTKFIQTIRLVMANGQSGGEIVSELVMTHNVVRGMVPLETFPVGVPGECRMKLYLYKAGEPEGEPITEFPMTIQYIPATGLPTKP
jgi:hypothetical protein